MIERKRGAKKKKKKKKKTGTYIVAYFQPF